MVGAPTVAAGGATDSYAVSDDEAAGEEPGFEDGTFFVRARKRWITLQPPQKSRSAWLQQPRLRRLPQRRRLPLLRGPMPESVLCTALKALICPLLLPSERAGDLNPLN